MLYSFKEEISLLHHQISLSRTPPIFSVIDYSFAKLHGISSSPIIFLQQDNIPLPESVSSGKEIFFSAGNYFLQPEKYHI